MIEWCKYTKVRVLRNTVTTEEYRMECLKHFHRLGAVGTSIDLFEVHLTALMIPWKEGNGRIIFGIQLQRPIKWSLQGMTY
jgi:hypothetical protein